MYRSAENSTLPSALRGAEIDVGDDPIGRELGIDREVDLADDSVVAGVCRFVR